METLLSPFTPDSNPLDPQPSKGRGDFFDQYRYYILGGLIIIFAVGIYLILTPPRSSIDNALGYVAGENESAQASTGLQAEIVVDIEGGVNQPGVYRLNEGSIIEDAIDAANGLSDQADLDEIARSINRAALIPNHSKIYLPKRGDNQIVYVNPPSYSPANPLTSLPTNLVNINTASNTELDLLPGVGPITAQRIIDYRLQSGPFSSIDELQEVPGIGNSKFDNLKDHVTV